MNFSDFLFDALSTVGLFGSGEANKADIDPINKKLSLISLGLILISVLLIYFFKTEIFEIENLLTTILWSFSASILLMLIASVVLYRFKIIHSLAMSSFVFILLSSSVFVTLLILVLKSEIAQLI